MKNPALIILAVVAFIAVSCKKDSNNTTSGLPHQADYYQLKPGNYWIYEGYQVDTNGVATSTGLFDSSFVQKDTVINSRTYSKIYESPYVLSSFQTMYFVRDSSGYLVDHLGRILASDYNFTGILRTDTAYSETYTAYLKMTGKDSLVTVQAGTFPSITARLKVIVNPVNYPGVPDRYLYDVYGKGIGKIKTHGFFLFSKWSMEARLVRYHINS